MDEFLAVVLSRALRDDTLGLLGTRSEVAAAACALAQRRHAPGLSVLSGPSGVVNPRPGVLRPVADDGSIAEAEALTDLTDNIDLIDWSRRRIDFAVLGGIQVDRFGNINTVAVGDWARPRLRGPGAIGASVLAGHAATTFIVLSDHAVRSLPPVVDFVSAIGFGRTGRERAELGLPGGGPSLLLTPLGTFDFEGLDHCMRIRTVHPWSSVEEIAARTGFPLATPDGEPPMTPAPLAAELADLRGAVDRTGVLTRA
jgi:glutaconate CoA-transferase subunit B